MKWIVLLYLSIAPMLISCWEIAVANTNQLNLFNETKTEEAVVHDFHALEVITYDSHNQELYLSDYDQSKRTNTVFSFRPENTTSRKIVTEYVGSVINGLAYDPVSSALFWTENNAIKRLQNNTVSDLLADPSPLQFQTPRGIAVDVCERFVYWTNVNNPPSIERALMDGSGYESIIHDGLHKPLGIAVDYDNHKLIWCDDASVFFTIERSNLDGTGREVLVKSKDHRPVAIAVGRKYVYWSDWTKPGVQMTLKDRQAEPDEFVQYRTKVPYGLVAWLDYSPQSRCSRLEHTTEQTALSVPVEDSTVPMVMECQGSSCENLCEDYCLNGGTCHEGSEQQPSCECPMYTAGEQCEFLIEPEQLCELLCRHGHHAHLTSLCMCSGVVDNSTHQHRSSVPCLELDNPILIALVGVCLFLMLTVVVLAQKVCILRRRPRIKKRIIVNRNNTPLTSRPPVSSQQCEITIENCCDMSVCETPCFDPQSRTSSHMSKKEEKKNLLGSMEDD